MGAGASNPLAQAAAKNQANEAAQQAKDGFNTLTGGKTDKEKEREQRLAYHKQLEELQKAAERSSNYQKDKEEGEEMLSSLSTVRLRRRFLC